MKKLFKKLRWNYIWRRYEKKGIISKELKGWSTVSGSL